MTSDAVRSKVECRLLDGPNDVRIHGCQELSLVAWRGFSSPCWKRFFVRPSPCLRVVQSRKPSHGLLSAARDRNKSLVRFPQSGPHPLADTTQFVAISQIGGALAVCGRRYENDVRNLFRGIYGGGSFMPSRRSLGHVCSSRGSLRTASSPRYFCRAMHLLSASERQLSEVLNQ
jgi:hypothetical protein